VLFILFLASPTAEVTFWPLFTALLCFKRFCIVTFVECDMIVRTALELLDLLDQFQWWMPGSLCSLGRTFIKPP
jgi:hypothetical protein